MIIHHDPFVASESFDEWINAYHGTLILNVKEEGLEARLISLMQSKGLMTIFFSINLSRFFGQMVEGRRASVRCSYFRVQVNWQR